MNRFLYTLFLLLVSAFPARAIGIVADNDSVQRARAVEYYYMQALSLLEEGRFDEAFDMFEHCRAQDPSSTAVLYNLSPFYVALDRDSLAHDALLRMVEAEPHNPDYSQSLVDYYYKIGDLESAISLYEDMLQYSESKSEIYMALYSLYSDRVMSDKAIEMLDALEKAEGNSDEISYQKLRQYMQMRENDKAIALVEGLIASSPDDMRYVSLLGDVYLYTGNYEKAEKCYWDVVAVEPDEVITLSSLSSLYKSLGNDSLFTKTTEMLLKSEKLDVEHRLTTLVEYAMLKDSAYMMDFFRELMLLPFDQLEISETFVQYMMYKNVSPDTIRPVLHKIISIEPENTSAMLQLLSYAIDDNDYTEVIRLSDNAMMYIPEMLELYYYKGLSCYLLDRKKECVEVYELGLSRRREETAPDHVSAVFSSLGDVYHELDMMEKCTQAYDSALVYNPDNLGVLNNYAYYLALDNSRLEKALSMSRKTIDAEPENPIFIDTYAWVLFILERYEEAKAYAEKMIQISGEMGAVELHHCGDIFAKCGDMERALLYWQKAIDAGDDSKILKKKIKKRKYYNAKRK